MVAGDMKNSSSVSAISPRRAPPSGPRSSSDDSCAALSSFPSPRAPRRDASLSAPPTPRGERTEPVGSAICCGAHSWVKRILSFLESNGQDLLQAICTRYKINFDGTVASIPEGMLEQVAYNSIFNPALPKVTEGDGILPMMLRDVQGVSNFKMVFRKDKAWVFKSVTVSCRLKGSTFEIECRVCSYCGSCFSGRFMELDSAHQRAGGWKEITDKIHAGKHSWKALRNWRLCVPCFTNYGQKGTMDNSNRLRIHEVIQSAPTELFEGTADDGWAGCRSKSDSSNSSLAGQKRGPDSASNDKSKGFKRKRERLTVEVDEAVEINTEGDWWDAIIAQTDATSGLVLVHYVGGTAEEDEWLPRDSDRLRHPAGSPPSTKESVSTTSGSFSPDPTTNGSNSRDHFPNGCATPQATPIRRAMTSPQWGLGRDASAQPCGAMAEESPPVAPGKMSPGKTHNMSPFPEQMWSLDDEEEVAEESEQEEEEWLLPQIPDAAKALALPTFVDVVLERPPRGALANTVEVTVEASGCDLYYQWFEGSEAIPGAQRRSLVLLNSGETGGPIRCLVRNTFGASWACCPVLLPSSPQDAKAACDAIQGPGIYRFHCRCGHERVGSAVDMCTEACVCGAVCAGTSERLRPIRSLEQLTI